MFHEKRQFRAIVFSAPGVKGVSDLLAKVPDQEFLTIRDMESPIANVDVTHLQYLTTSQFVDPVLLDSITVKRGRKKYFRYDMYAGCLRRGRKAYLFAAVPFARMAYEVFGLLDKVTSNQGRYYQIADMKRLMGFLEADEEQSRRFAATSIRFQISGDADLATLSMAGGNVLTSSTFRRIKGKLGGIELVPHRMRLTHDSDIGRFVCECDGIGSFWCRLTSEGRNLIRFGPFLEVFAERNILRDEATYPLRKTVIEVEESEDVN